MDLETQLILNEAKKRSKIERLDDTEINQIIDTLQSKKSRLELDEEQLVELNTSVFSFIGRNTKTLLSTLNNFTNRVKNKGRIQTDEALHAILANQAILASLIVKSSVHNNALKEMILEHEKELDEGDLFSFDVLKTMVDTEFEKSRKKLQRT